MQHNKLNILLTAFLVILFALSIVGFAYKFGYIIPDWVGWVALGATVLNYGIFGLMISASFRK